MRTAKDRIRHAISFEVIGLILVTTLGALFFDYSMFGIGVVALAGSLAATAWNYVYNLIFDIALARVTGSTLKSFTARVVHAVLFEAGLLALLLPFVAWYLGIGLWQALILEVAFALFYLGYAFVFNLAYDRMFPLPEWQTGTEKS